MTRILAHTLGENVKSFCKVNRKFQLFFFLFLYIAPYKRKPSSGAKSCTYRCVSRRANPLLFHVVCLTLCFTVDSREPSMTCTYILCRTWTNMATYTSILTWLRWTWIWDWAWGTREQYHQSRSNYSLAKIHIQVVSKWLVLGCVIFFEKN